MYLLESVNRCLEYAKLGMPICKLSVLYLNVPTNKQFVDSDLSFDF